jgi:general stress protein 26
VDTTNDHDVKKLAELIHDIDFTMMTTVSADGTLRSRPMSTQKTPFNGELWFFTEEPSGKTHEVTRDRHVNLAYADPKAQKYVSVSGVADVVRDRAKAEELWNPLYKAWFPGGLDDPTLALLRVRVTSAEYWDSPSSKVMHLVGFVKAIATGQQYTGEGADHGTVTMK